MTSNNRLQFKVIGIFCLLLTGMLAFQAETISGSIEITEDNVIGDILQKEASAYQDQYQTEKVTPLPRLQNLQAYVGTSEIPQELQNTIRDRKEGIYETDGPDSIPGPERYNILISSLPDGNKLYLFYHSDQTLKESSGLLKTKHIRILMFVATAGFGIILVCITGFIVFKPLRSLSERVESAGPENITRDFPEIVRNDEIGLLARNIQDSYKRIQKFVERERQFTRDVSHELRTPLSVITGAADLIPVLLPEPDPKLEKALTRINRATGHMQQTISTFLWLAREENLKDDDVFCDVNSAIHATIEDLPATLIPKDVELNVLQGDHLVIPAPENIFRIVFSNLLTNALSFTTSGSIDIEVKGHKVTITDTGEGIPEAIAQKILQPHVQGKTSKGFGLGLSIATDVCSRFNWELSIRRREAKGTKATITFPQPPTFPSQAPD